jgi:hypothetical protein
MISGNAEIPRDFSAGFSIHGRLPGIEAGMIS